MKKYQINAICDPHHASCHYNGQRVVRYDVATPVEWVMVEGLSLEEAYKTLDAYASDLGDDYFWVDDEFVNSLKSWIDDESIDDNIDDTSWYKGKGVYTNHGVLVYQHGDMSLSDDVMLYNIEEM